MLICNNPWCKASFLLNENLPTEEQQVCPKCKSFNSELSAGVTWRDKEYEGNRWDPTPHQFSYKIKNFF
jgi:hypothetical protein